MTTFTLSKNSILRCCNSCLIVVLIELINLNIFPAIVSMQDNS